MMEYALSSIDTVLRGAGRRFVREYPEFETVLVHARDRYARTYIGLRTLVNRLRYDAPPRPYRFIEVDPATIEYTDPLAEPKFRHAGVVTGGEWDRTTDRFEDMDVYRAYRRHFEDGVPWEDTEFFDRIVSELENGGVRWGCRTREEFEDRCERLDRLYEVIRTEGYRTQAELRESNAADPIKKPHPLKTERLKDEIAVNIGRDGEIFFSDGRNRLSIAKLLDLDSVSARVLRRHRDWQAVRDAYVRGDPLPEGVEGHPDLVDLERASV